MKDLSSFSMQELFRGETETQCDVLSDGLVGLQSNPSHSAELFQTLMRAAHSIKGAARIVECREAVEVAHAMENVFSGASKAPAGLDDDRITLMLQGTDLLRLLADSDPGPEIAQRVADFILACTSTAGAPVPKQKQAATSIDPAELQAPAVRIQRQHLEHLISSAAELLVLMQSVIPEVRIAEQIVGEHKRLCRQMERLCTAPLAPAEANLANQSRSEALTLNARLSSHLAVLDELRSQVDACSRRIYDSALDCRMRPISDLLSALRRTTHDIARELNKRVRLEVTGGTIEADRDLIEFLESPLTHLIRNAVDHGIETPDERLSSGKPVEGVISIHARHIAGRLSISVADDGRGLNFEKIRSRILQAGLSDEKTIPRLNPRELLSFLFLPGFSLRKDVTEISGRGVGLDIVQHRIHSLRGDVRALNNEGPGATFILDLPVSLAVVSSAFVNISGEPYAFPLARIDRIFRLDSGNIEIESGSEYFVTEQGRLPLTHASAILELPPLTGNLPDVSQRHILQLSEGPETHGIMVDDLLGRGQILARPLHPAFGTIREIRSASVLPDGSPVLLIDVDEFLATVRHQEFARRRQFEEGHAGTIAARRALVVEDSVTVRETEARLLRDRGYKVDVASDGLEGWVALLTFDYDVLVTDIDMPRMDGIRLIQSLRAGTRNRNIWVVTITYKNREEDRKRALQAGADAFLTKDRLEQDLIRCVDTLIGDEPTTPGAGNATHSD